MALPLGYNLRNLLVRRTATLMSMGGIALVVAVFVVVSALAEGFRAAVAETGSPDNVLVMRDGATSEIQSAMNREIVDLLRSLPEVARDASGRPVASVDMVLVVNHPRLGGEGSTNVTVRGVSGAYREVRPSLAIAEGRWFTPGSDEIVVGEALSRRVADCQIGGTVRQSGRGWKVVGIFRAEGTAHESEVWGDADVMLDAFQREVYQSVTLRLAEGRDSGALAALFGRDLRLKSLQAEREDRYYGKQSEDVTLFLRTLGIVVTAVMSIGAIFGAMNTMYASVAHRSREIGTLLAIGFHPTTIFLAFLVESLLLSAAGALAGCLLALPVDGLATGTSNWATFSEVAFQFRVTPGVLRGGLLFGLVMGFVGGALPALRAARSTIIAALRRT